MKMSLGVIAFVFLLMFFMPSSALADGIIIPEPPICIGRPCPPPPPPCPDPPFCPPRPPIVQLDIRYHKVRVTIQDQLAITHVDQVFFNPNEWQVEGTYIFPIPLDAAVSSFTLWVDGKPIEGKILGAEEARQTYEEIVRKTNDPALLEYVGQGAVQARIFPIPPQGERRIELEYVQVLTSENGLVRYTYPLSTEKFSRSLLEQVSISVDVHTTNTPIRAAYSPSHDISVSREGDFHVSVGYEAQNVRPDTDFVLYYSLGESEAFHLFTYRDPGDPSDPDGFFLILLAPRPDTASQILPKDVIVVLDHSGSMEGEKFQQAQEALRYILWHLNAEDRFNVIAFSTGVESYASTLRQASEAEEAIAWVESLSAQGSTDINRALLEAAFVADRERPTYLIFLTDGLPTEGVTDSQAILDNFASAARGNLRLFAFGVGYDVDTFLLDSLARNHHGSSTYVLPGERLDEKLSAFYERINAPVLVNLELDFGDLRTYDVYPQPLPDLFAGTQIVVVGRYRGGGTTTVTLRGEVNGQMQVFRFPEQTFAQIWTGTDETALIPRLWATRKIGYLLNRIRLRGPDQQTVDQIVRLSIRYGIVTPYTSYLVTEEAPLSATEQERFAREQFQQLQATLPLAPAYGQEAVEKAAAQGSMADAQSVTTPPEETVEKLRVIGSHSYIFQDGVWVDTAFDPGVMSTVKVAFLSDDYFALVASNPDLAAAFALGQRVIALSNGVFYEVVAAGTPVELLNVPPTPTPTLRSSPPTETPLSIITSGIPATTPQPVPGMVPCASGPLTLVILILTIPILLYFRVKII